MGIEMIESSAQMQNGERTTKTKDNQSLDASGSSSSSPPAEALTSGGAICSFPMSRVWRLVRGECGGGAAEIRTTSEAVFLINKASHPLGSKTSLLSSAAAIDDFIGHRSSNLSFWETSCASDDNGDGGGEESGGGDSGISGGGVENIGGGCVGGGGGDNDNGCGGDAVGSDIGDGGVAGDGGDRGGVGGVSSISDRWSLARPVHCRSKNHQWFLKLGIQTFECLYEEGTMTVIEY
ncbi:hypothetical protein KSP40_PGU011471 [Platanthera guangdongensis]|uniref:Uncharacterized protein n=1 Tax=Platanthera guangdongensis TaxID=2320717 RepID=A0ABR2LQM7_9ASPA